MDFPGLRKRGRVDPDELAAIDPNTLAAAQSQLKALLSWDPASASAELEHNLPICIKTAKKLISDIKDNMARAGLCLKKSTLLTSC